MSSEGCLQFSLLLRHGEARTLIFLQYVFAMAVVEAVRSAPGLSDVNIRLKWPNDIYAGEDDVSLAKIGGVLLSSSLVNGSYQVIIGCGLNVDNPAPTKCINQVIASFNKSHGASLNPMPREQILGRIVSCFDRLYRTLCDAGTFQPLHDAYCRYWIHKSVD